MGRASIPRPSVRIGQRGRADLGLRGAHGNGWRGVPARLAASSAELRCMLRNAFFLARQDLVRLLRVRETLVWTFVMPILFFYFIGTITANIAGPVDSRDFLALQASAGELLAGPLADRLEAAG